MKFKKLWEQWCHSGLKWPYAYDPTTKKPSITLLMLYFATIVMFSAAITNLFLNSILVPTLTTVMIWVLAFVFYRMRKIDNFKLDLDDQTIEIGSNSNQKETDSKDEE